MNESIIDRLRKLIRHERSARSIGSMAEAEAFAEKIQELLDEYNLSLSDIDMNEVRSSIGIEHADIKLNARWQQIFAIKIGRLNGCKVIRAWNGIKVVGSAMDRLIVIEIYEYFEDLARVFADRYIREYQKTSAYTRKRKRHLHSRRERESFCLGFTFTVAMRLEERMRADLEAAQTSTALIFIGNKLADADAFAEQHLEIKTVKAKKLKDIRSDAFGRGVELGNAVALTTKTVAPKDVSRLRK